MYFHCRLTVDICSVAKSSVKSYIGMTSRPFIERFKEHKGNIKHKHQKGTKLSSYVWKQKDFVCCKRVHCDFFQAWAKDHF